MKSVTLIGDSIRMGYQQHVQRALDGSARIWGPHDNGGDSNNVRVHLQEWILDRDAEVVHLNCGLHDLKKDFDNGHPQVDSATYRANLIHIFDTVLAAGHKLVWATTTPVNELWHHERKGFDRFSADVNAYNTIAAEEAEHRGIAIHDLHNIIATAGRDQLLVEDGVHFSEVGYTLLGQAVADYVRQHWAYV